MLTQSPLFTGLQLEFNSARVTVKYKTAGFAYNSTVDPEGMDACFPMLSQPVVSLKSVPEKEDMSEYCVPNC